MSKKDKDKDKRKKHEGKPERSPWLADLRPARTPPPPPDPEAEGSPVTRRSSPLPPDLPPDALHVPPLRTPTFDPITYDELGEDTLGDIAPVAPMRPTEHAAAPPSVAPPLAEVTGETRAPSVGELEQQIRDLEARLDDMIRRGAPSSRASLAGAEPAAPPVSGPRPSTAAPPPAAAMARAPRATARELLSSDFYLRRWGRTGLRRRAEEVDEFGLDPKYEARFLPFFDFLYKHYFRVEAEGTEHIPAEGRCLVVANHSGGPLPYDGIMLRTAVRRELEGGGVRRELRWLAEDFVYHLPFVGTAMNRLGAVRACQENAERLLAGERLVAVFPEGAKGIGKLYKDRYRLQRFGRGGFIRLCLRTGTPIVPAAIVGAEEASPMLYRVEYMAKTLGIPYLPVTPTFPALGPLGLLPAPTKWKMSFGEPISFDEHGPEDADDDVLVGRLADRVRGTIQAMLDRTLSGRRSVWFG